jgi:hypothetical protein
VAQHFHRFLRPSLVVGAIVVHREQELRAVS